MGKMINLGREYDACSPCCAEKPASKSSKKGEKRINYPTLYLSGVNLGVGTGEFEFSGKGKVVSVSERTRDGKTEYSCEIEVHAMSVDGGEASKEDGLEGALKDIASKKTKSSKDEEGEEYEE